MTRTWDAKASLTGVVHAADTYDQGVKALINNLHIPYGQGTKFAFHDPMLTVVLATDVPCSI